MNIIRKNNSISFYSGYNYLYLLVFVFSLSLVKSDRINRVFQDDNYHPQNINIELVVVPADNANPAILFEGSSNLKSLENEYNKTNFWQPDLYDLYGIVKSIGSISDKKTNNQNVTRLLISTLHKQNISHQSETDFPNS